MTQLYRRHTQKCGRGNDRSWTKCTCPIWIEGTLSGQYERKSLKTSSWQAASRMKTQLDAADAWDLVEEICPKRIDQAMESYLRDASSSGRGLRFTSVKKYRQTMKQLKAYADDRGFLYLKQLDVDAMTEFRSRLETSPVTVMHKISRIRTFFRFCKERGWISADPSKPIKVKVEPKTHQPFSPGEYEKIVAELDTGPSGKATPEDHARLQAMVYLLRYSGFRIGDAVAAGEHIIADEQPEEVRLYIPQMQKTRRPVRVVVPRWVIDACRVAPAHGSYYFSDPIELADEKRREQLTHHWYNRIRKLCEEGGVKHGHPHRFRDTFAVELLKSGANLETVSKLLGHSSIKITEKHYAPWVEERLMMLDSACRRAWNGGGGNVVEMKERGA